MPRTERWNVLAQKTAAVVVVEDVGRVVPGLRLRMTRIEWVDAESKHWSLRKT